MTRKHRSAGNRKVANSLMALSSAAVLGVYSAGFVRTRAAAQRFAEADLRRTPIRAQAASPAMAAAPESIAAPAAPVAPPVTTAPPQASAATPRASNSRSSNVAARPAPAPIALPKKSATAPRAASIAAAPVPAASAPDTTTSPAALDPSPAAAPAPASAVSAPASPAPAPAAPQAAAPATATTYKDGTYSGWGTSRHGDIQATVVIENGRIASASISQCLTRYPCSWIVALPPQVAQRQSPEVDYVSGATQSTNAFYYAVVEALSKAK